MAVSLISNYFRFLRVHPSNFENLSPILSQNLQGPIHSEYLAVRHGNARYTDPRWRAERRAKILKVNLPDYDEQRQMDKLTHEEIRTKMKEKGFIPARKWTEKTMCISCTGGVFEPYVPPEGDGKRSLISSEGAKQRLSLVEKKGKSMLAIRKIRSFDENFDMKTFLPLAQDIYEEAHRGLNNLEEHEDRLHELVTENCFPNLVENIRNKTVRWKFVKSLDQARVVHARQTNMIQKTNIFAQLTVRFHSQQTLAVYDRFGRLIHGSEVIAKDVLEYVVFERHLADEYGGWRIHSKIIPEWMPPKEPVHRTFAKPQKPVEPNKDKNENVKVMDKENEQVAMA